MSAIPLSVDKLPPQLKNQLIWVLWHSDPSRGKPTKVPYQPSGQKARCNDSETWASFAEVYQAYTRSLSNGRPYDGIGIMLGCEIQGRTLVGIDLDSCRYADGTLTAEATLIIERVDSYAEISPSGTGVKILCLIDEPIDLGNKTGFPYREDNLEQTSDGKAAEVAYWQSNRFFVMTGQVLDGYSQLLPSQGVRDVVAEYRSRKDAAKATKTHAAASEPATTTTAADEFAERQRAALDAIRKIPVGTNENDGSSRLLNYCRQAKRFMLNEHDCLRLVKQGIARFQFPSQWTDAEILQRIADADVSYGQDFEPRVTTAIGSLDATVQTTSTPKLRPVSFVNLITGHPELRPSVVDGLLRAGETCNLIASPKVGKSFLGANLACSVAKGCPWLGHDVAQGCVLILDNELHKETLSSRLGHVARAMQLTEADENCIDVIPLRGLQVNINELGSMLEIEPGKYCLIVLDALYRVLPDGTSENDNAQMMRVYNQLDSLASQWNAAIVVIHHTSRGDQSTKALTDLGAGAGAISRAADSHIAIRPHEIQGLAVMEAVTRSWKSPEPLSVKFEYPLWHAVAVTPEVKTPKGGADRKQEANDRQADEAVIKAIKGTRGLSRPQLRTKTGFGQTRVDRAVARLLEAGKIIMARRRNLRTKKRIEVVQLSPECTE